MEVGGVIAGEGDDVVKALFAYGDALGISFQIVDDLLDYRGNTQATGKNVGDDFRERKLTLPVIKAVAKADTTERDFWQRTIAKGDQRDGDLEEALRLMDSHGTLDATRADAVAWADKAKASLSVIEQSELKDMLLDLADYVVARVR